MPIAPKFAAALLAAAALPLPVAADELPDLKVELEALKQRVVQKDAQFGGYGDSDWGAGNTDYHGSGIKAGYAIAKNGVLNAAIQLSDISRHTAPLDYKRLQLDLNF